MELGTVIGGIIGGFVAGAIQKHAISRLPNDAIPFINGIIVGGATLAMTKDAAVSVQAGLSAAVGGTGAHQVIKIGVKHVINKGLKAILPGRLYGMKVDPWIAKTNSKIGPGHTISI